MVHLNILHIQFLFCLFSVRQPVCTWWDDVDAIVPLWKYWVNVGLPRFRAASASSCRWSSGRRCPSALFASPCFSRDNQGRTTRTPSLATRWGPRRRLWFPRFATWLQSELGIMELELWMDLMRKLFGRTCWTFTALTFLFVWICRTLNFSVYFGCAAARNDES